MTYAVNPPAAAATTSPFRENTAAQSPANPALLKILPWQAQIHHDHNSLETLWRQLEADGRCTVFQTYDWAACWYDTVSAHDVAEPLIVTVGKEGGGPVWILPLCRYRRKALRVICFADLGVTDYAAPLMARDAPSDPQEIKAMLKAVFAALPRCDIINFEKLAAAIEGRPNPLLNLRGIVRFPANCYGIRLTAPWPDLAKNIMQRRLYATVKRQRERISHLGEPVLLYEDAPAALSPALDQLMALRRERFAAIERPDMAPLWHDFYYQLATQRRRTLDVNITALNIGGETVATCFGLTHRGAYHAILPTFAIGKWEKFRPGMLLFDEMINLHAERVPGSGYFDFTIGDEDYKKRFGGESHALYEWVSPRSITGLVIYALWRAKVKLRRHPGLFNQIKRMLGRA